MPPKPDQDPAIAPDAQNQDQSAPTIHIKKGLIGQKLGGRYLIERELGRGGMGVVYLAHDKPELLSRPVVVKVLLEQGLKNDWVVKKFQQEIESLTRLDDPGVIGIFDAGTLEDGTPYLVMQFLDGSNLRALITPEGINLQHVANIMKQIGRSMSVAHDAGILHRDLKPENIMLRKTASGEQQVKIIDFGIAKIRNSMVGTSTVTGRTAGTLGYMSPEQLSAQPLTPASDIYSLGAIAYEMVTGRRPFNPDSAYQLLDMLRAGVRVKPTDLRPSLPEKAQEIILKALSFDPQDRFQRAQDFGDKLDRALNPQGEVGELTTRDLPEIKPREIASKTSLPPTVSFPAKGEPASLETAHVLFSDIVGYSKLLIDEQSERLQELQDMVRNTSEFQRAQAAGQLLRLPTGDGMALSFFGDPEAPVRCAVEISRELKNHPKIQLRMGINSGLVYRIEDINANMNVAGGGINMAQRVMDCGDAGHIIVSKRDADDLSQLSRWAADLHDLGEAEVKHGVRIHVYSLYNDEIGNAEVPEKLRRTKPQSGKTVRWLGVAAALVVVLTGGLYLARNLFKAQPAQPVQTPSPISEAAAASQRVFTYFLIPADRAEEHYTGNERFRNGDRFVFVLIPEQSGVLYLLDRGVDDHNRTSWYVLFPQPEINKGSSAVTANQRMEVPIKFDSIPGSEYMSIIWAAQPIPELEQICKDAARTEFEIKDAQIVTISTFLAKHESPVPKAETDIDKKQTTVKGQGDIVVYQGREKGKELVLKHSNY